MVDGRVRSLGDVCSRTWRGVERDADPKRSQGRVERVQIALGWRPVGGGVEEGSGVTDGSGERPVGDESIPRVAMVGVEGDPVSLGFDSEQAG